MLSRQEPGFTRQNRLTCTIGNMHYVMVFLGDQDLFRSIVKLLGRVLAGHIYSFLDADCYGLMSFTPNPRLLSDFIVNPSQMSGLRRLASEEDQDQAIHAENRPKRLRTANAS